MNEDMYIGKEFHANIRVGTYFLGESSNIDENAVQ